MIRTNFNIWIFKYHDQFDLHSYLEVIREIQDFPKIFSIWNTRPLYIHLANFKGEVFYTYSLSKPKYDSFLKLSHEVLCDILEKRLNEDEYGHPFFTMYISDQKVSYFNVRTALTILRFCNDKYNPNMIYPYRGLDIYQSGDDFYVRSWNAK